jgi:AmmeMemoRadiSam system protein B
MGQLRYPAMAGRFYPAEERELRAAVREYLDEAPIPDGRAPKAIIAPHAGYVYSGPVAASAYARLAPDRERIERIVLLGPSHRVAFDGLAATAAEAWESPLGRVKIDRDAIARIASLPQVLVDDRPHALEHSLEVHVPFLQEAIGDFSLVPLAVGDAAPAEVAEVLEALWGGPETRIVVSSDLSHYHDYATARRLDEATSRHIESLQYEEIAYGDACGRNPINGLLAVARRRGLRATTVDLRSSGDTAGPRDQVVGYGAYVVD